jgi:hypothetical protein
MTIKQLVWYCKGTSAIVRIKIKRLQAHFGDSLCQVLIWREGNLLLNPPDRALIHEHAQNQFGPQCATYQWPLLYAKGAWSRIYEAATNILSCQIILSFKLRLL